MSAIVVFILLSVSTVTDIRKKEIPIFLWVISTVVTVGLMIFLGSFQYINLITAFALAILFFIEAKFFNGGGGDIVMMSCIGLLLGIPSLHITLISVVTVLIFYFLSRSWDDEFDTTEIPIAPYVLLGETILLLGGKLL